MASGESQNVWVVSSTVPFSSRSRVSKYAPAKPGSSRSWGQQRALTPARVRPAWRSRSSCPLRVSKDGLDDLAQWFEGLLPEAGLLFGPGRPDQVDPEPGEVGLEYRAVVGFVSQQRLALQRITDPAGQTEPVEHGVEDLPLVGLRAGERPACAMLAVPPRRSAAGSWNVGI